MSVAVRNSRVMGVNSEHVVTLTLLSGGHGTWTVTTTEMSYVLSCQFIISPRG